MNDLLDRYLAAVARQLPERQKADVTAELRDELLSKIEEREDALGRPLARDELEALLIDYGHPVAVAGRYRRFQHLIGPEVYPYWWAGLKLTLGFVVAVYVVVGVVAAFSDGVPVVTSRISDNLFVAMIFTFGLVTAACAALERFGMTAILTRWTPRDLPPVRARGRGRFDIAAEAVAGVVLIAWWLGLIHFSDLASHLIRDLDVKLAMAQVWRDLWWPILGYLVFELAINILALARPGLVRANGLLRIGRNLIGAGLALLILQAGHWLDVTGPWATDAALQVQANFDKGMRLGIGATVLIFIGLAVWESWRLRQDLSAMRSPMVTRAA